MSWPPPPTHVCEACGAFTPNWGLCVAKGLGARRGHSWVKLPECMSCEDTGYEPGMPGFYCTFCKAGFKVAAEQVKSGLNPFDPFGDERREREESDEDKRRYEDWGVGE